MATASSRAVRTLARLSRLIECGLGDVSLAQYRVLAAVDDGGERATLLARHLALAKPTVTATVDGLVDRGYVVREPVPGDRRALRIALTPSGTAALAAAEEAMAAKLAGVLGHADDPQAAAAALEALAPVLDRAARAAAAALPAAGR